MKLLIFLTAIFFMHYKSIGQQLATNGCRDSSIRITYKINTPSSDYGELSSLILRDTALLNFSGYTDSSGTHPVLTKFNSRYNIAWSHSLSLPGKKYLYIYNNKELSTGEILITGYTGIDQNLLRDTALNYYFALLNKNGNVIWQFLMRPQPTPNNGPLVTAAIAEENGEIYLILGDNSLKILNVHHNGTLGWCKSFFKNNTGIGGASSLFINGNQLNVILNNQNPKESQCGDIFTQRMLVMKMDRNNGNLLYQQNYCYPVTINYYQERPYQAIQLSSGQYVLTLVNEKRKTGQNFTLFYFDTSLLPIKTISITNNNALQIGNANNIVINKNGKILLTWLELDLNSNIGFAPKQGYALIDSNANFVVQKKVNTVGDLNGFSNAYISPLLLNRNGFKALYTKQGDYYFDFFDLSDSVNTNDNCLGYDSTIFNLWHIDATPSNFNWDSIVNGKFTQSSVNAISSPFLYIKTEVCKKLVVCDTLTITGPSTICLGKADVQYRIHKNGLCDKKIKFIIDSNYCKLIQNTGDSLLQLQFIKPGKTKLYASIENCVLTDSLEIILIEPKTNFSINKDSLLCPGKNLLLQASKGFAAYRWQDGTIMDNLLVTDTGFYKVSATDSCGNIFSDSIKVKLSDTAFSMPATAAICNTDTLKMPPVPSYFYNITWQPFSGASYSMGSFQFFPSQTTTYTISLESGKNCKTQKIISVVVNDCPADIFFPNSFTPNGDKINDVFKLFISLPLQYYHITIYNRMGQKVFESSNPLTGWNGEYKGTQQDPAAFIYHCTYKFFNKPAASKKGYCILIR